MSCHTDLSNNIVLYTSIYIYIYAFLELLERANKLQKRLKQSGLDNKKAVTAKTKENDRVWVCYLLTFSVD